MRKMACLLFCCCVACLAVKAGSKEDDACWRVIQKGNGYLWRFMPLEAWGEYHTALRMAQQLHHEFLTGEALLGIGQALWYNGRFSEAVDTVKLSLEHYRKGRATGAIGGALRILSNIYDDQGDYENAFRTVSEAIEFYRHDRNADDYNHNRVLALVQMGALYKNIGDYETALDYYEQGEALHPEIRGYAYRELNNRMGELYAARGEIDQARSYYRKALTGNPRSKLVRLHIGDTYLQEKKYDIAFKYYDSLYAESKLAADVNIIIACQLGMSKIYLHQHNLPLALQLVQGSLAHSSLRGARQNKRDAYQLLSAIYEASGNNVQALEYHKQYELLKDSVVSENFKGQLFAFRQQAEAAKLKAQLNILLAGILGLLLAGIFIFFIINLRHKNEKLQLKHRATELEMQALRAQMNPHFIFNCLSSINHFILNKEDDRASDYLTRFSRLIRMVLVNAGKAVVTLEEELAMLRLYLNMEQLRFKEAFDYHIYFDPGLHASMIVVPSFILQPFCENAIWHGLLHKEAKGQLNIHFSVEKGILVCTITDNGIGRQQAAAFKKLWSAEKIASFGNRLSAERLALFNGNMPGTSFTIEDVIDENGESCGTRVILKIHNKQVYD
jgi:tetratricopeptide (TPR) repeat protein